MDNYYVHESSIIDSNVSIGNGTKIWHFCHVMSNAQIGNDCVLGQNTYVATQTKIGNNVHIQNNVSIYDKIIIEDDVFIGPSVVFTNVKYPRAKIHKSLDEYLPTTIKKGVSIGANSTIICGITIGEYAMIGAGSVVTKDMPDYALVYDSPAVVKGWVCKCGNQLDFGQYEEKPYTFCSCCERKYSKYGITVKFIPKYLDRKNSDKESQEEYWSHE